MGVTSYLLTGMILQVEGNKQQLPVCWRVIEDLNIDLCKSYMLHQVGLFVSYLWECESVDVYQYSLLPYSLNPIQIQWLGKYSRPMGRIWVLYYFTKHKPRTSGETSLYQEPLHFIRKKSELVAQLFFQPQGGCELLMKGKW